MLDKLLFCKKLKEIYPDIGECGVDVEVEYDEVERIWIVDLKKGNHELRTHMEIDEAMQCMEGKQCVSFGLQVAELRAQMERKSG